MADEMREVTSEEFDSFVEHYPPKKRIRREHQRIGIPETLDFYDVVTPGIPYPVARVSLEGDTALAQTDQNIKNTYWINDSSPEYLDILERFGLKNG